MPSQSPNEFVITSSVRTEIVLRIAERPTSTDVLLSETEAAIQWGRDLFEALWADSDPLGPYVKRNFPELWE